MAESAVKGHWDAPSGEVRQVTVPADARKLCTLAHVGYEDAFLVEVGDPGARTPEEWVRVIIESAPAVVRRALWPGGRRSVSSSTPRPIESRCSVGKSTAAR